MHARLLGALALTAALFVAAPAAHADVADVDPAGCTPDLQYDPSIPKYSDVLGAALGAGSRRPTLDLQTYQRAVVNATQNNPRVRVIEKKMSDTALGREVWYSVVSTPDNIANLDAGRNDAGFWSGVREGNISTAVGLSQIRTRPAFAWVTATPHGNEPAAGEASMRLLYEMAARMDCSNARRLQNITSFIVPATNPDGRDLNTRTTAWGFDPNRDRGTRVNMENDGFTEAIVKYPGVFVIDAHQQTNGYFFPPNEDAVHHEVSQFAIDFIQNDIGPMLQRMFNDQTVAYQNYNVYDLFAPIYGDSVPALLDGAAGMTYEKGSTEIYGKQVYDHYLAMDATENITSDQKVQILDGWVRQWGEARQQGAECQLQMNKLVSPLHTQIFAQPDTDVCGYFFQPNQSAGDTARLIGELTSTGVHVYKLDTAVNVAGVHPFGKSDPRVGTQTLPAGTLYVPMAQGQKHWIQAILGEDPVPALSLQLRRHAVVVPAHARHRRLRLPDAAVPAGRDDDRDHRPGPGHGERHGQPGVRVRYRLGAGAGHDDGPAGRGREGLARGGDVHRRRPDVQDRRGARGRLDAGHDRPGGDGEVTPDAGHRPARVPDRSLRARQAEDRALLHGRANPQNPTQVGERHEGRLLGRLLRGAVRAHAEDEGPGLADHAGLGDRRRQWQARRRRLHRVHQPGFGDQSGCRQRDHADAAGDPELRQRRRALHRRRHERHGGGPQRGADAGQHAGDLRAQHAGLAV